MVKVIGITMSCAVPGLNFHRANAFRADASRIDLPVLLCMCASITTPVAESMLGSPAQCQSRFVVALRKDNPVAARKAPDYDRRVVIILRSRCESRRSIS